MSEADPIALKRALLVPSAVFESPEAVMTAAGLTPEQRLEVLRRWEFDVRTMQAAEEEDTGDAEPALLRRIRAALRDLSVADDRRAVPDPNDA